MRTLLLLLAAAALAATPAAAQPSLPTGILDGTLADGDARGGDGTFHDPFVLQGARGERLWLIMESETFDPRMRLVLLDGTAEGQLVAEDDNSGPRNGAELNLRLPREGQYLLIAGSTGAGTGPYTLMVAGDRSGAEDTETEPDEEMDVQGTGREGMTMPPPVRDTVALGQAAVEGRFTGEGAENVHLYHYVAGRAERVVVIVRSSELAPQLIVTNVSFGHSSHEGLDENRDGDGEARLPFYAVLDNTYAIQVRAPAAAAGGYQLEIQRVPLN